MIEHLIINATFIIGLRIISSEGYVLHWYRRLCENVPFFHKPLITCPVCMSSIYGLLYVLIVIQIPSSQWQKVPVYLIALAGTVAVLKSLFELLLIVKDFFELKRDALKSNIYKPIPEDDNH